MLKMVQTVMTQILLLTPKEKTFLWTESIGTVSMVITSLCITDYNICGAPYFNNGICEDGGTGSTSADCPLGYDCMDCGPRTDQDEDGVDADIDCSDTDASIGLSDPAWDVSDFNGDGTPDEPFDSSNPIYLGSLNSFGDQVSANGFILDSSDQDAFQFNFEDDGGIWDCSETVTISTVCCSMFQIHLMPNSP